MRRLFTAATLLCLTALFIISTTGCSERPPTTEDMIYADVYYLTSDKPDEDTLVLTTRDSKKLTGYLNVLLLTEPNGDSIAADLTYRLDLRTSDAEHSFTMYFNLADQTAIASNETGDYTIPFEWLNEYLTELPLPEQFSHMEAPSFELYLSEGANQSEDYRISTGLTQQWSIHPTTDVTYDNNYSIEGYEVITRDNTDFTLHGTFSHNPPDDLTVEIIENNGGKSYKLNVTMPGPTESWDAFPTPEEPGDYSYIIDCTWNTPDRGYTGSIQYNFDLVIDVPVSYHINGDTYMPGDSIAVLIRNAKSLDYRVETKAYDKTVGLFYYDSITIDSEYLEIDEEGHGSLMAVDVETDNNSTSAVNPAFKAAVSQQNPRDLAGIVPLSSWTAPGDYQLQILVDSTGEILETFAYTVTTMEFPRQNLTVSSSTASLKSNDNAAKDREKYNIARDYSIGVKLWEGSFIEPLGEGVGRISTEYATTRFVNGSTTESSRHNAIDVAAPTGTPIMAANHGIVTYAGELIISGNMVMIDHGMGLFSSYIHMHDIYVKAGDRVSKGDVIGEVGTTGYSTGPHLHWSIWKNGVYLNPWTFINDDPFAALE